MMGERKAKVGRFSQRSISVLKKYTWLYSLIMTYTFSTQKLPMRKQKVAFHYREVIVIRQKYFCSERIEN